MLRPAPSKLPARFPNECHAELPLAGFVPRAVTIEPLPRFANERGAFPTEAPCERGAFENDRSSGELKLEGLVELFGARELGVLLCELRVLECAAPL